MTKQHISQSQLRGYKTLKALFGYEVAGIECNELAKHLTHSRSQTYKDLITLQAAGLAEQLPNKNWRLAPQLGREAIKILNHLEDTRRRLDEVSKRFGIFP